MLRIKLVKSPIGNNLRNRRTVIALGLRKVHQVVEQPDNPSIRGMIHHVKHLLSFEVVEGEAKGKAVKSVKAVETAEAVESAPAAPKAEKPAPKAKPADKKPAAKAAPKKKAEAKK